MSGTKKNRLKLKTKKTSNENSVIKVSEREGKETDPILTKSQNYCEPKSDFLHPFLQEPDVIHIIDDEDSNSLLNLPNPKVDAKLQDLQKKLLKFKFPVCDVWRLDDLPTYNPPMVSSGKESSPKESANVDNFLPLVKFSKEYLTSKRPYYDLTFMEDETTEKESNPKRKLSDDSEIDTKRYKNAVFNTTRLQVFTDIKDEQPSGSITSKNSSIVFDNTTKSCPICSVQFSQSTSQMDIDSHIASCLSLADDDVDW